MCSASRRRLKEWLEEDQVEQEIIEERIRAQTDEMMEAKLANYDGDIWRRVEKQLLLEQLDFPLEGTPRNARRTASGDLDARDRAENSRSTNTSRKPLRCSKPCSKRCAEDVTKLLFKSELRIAEPEPVDLPDLPDFLTGHIDPLTGLDNSNDGDGSAEAA